MTEQEDPVEAYKKALAAQQHSEDPVATYKAALAASAPQTPSGLKPVPPARGPIGNALQKGAAHILSAAQFIPGAEELEAGMGALGSHFPGQKTMNYAESLANLRANTNQINPYVKTAEQTVASLPTLGIGAIARMSPMAAGAMYGGLHGATKADPNISAEDVAQNAAKGGVLGATIGKGSEILGTGIRALKTTEAVQNAGRAIKDFFGGTSTPARTLDLGENAIQRDAARASESAKNYDAAISGANPATPQVHAVLNDPDFAPIVADLQESPSFRGTQPTNPNFIHTIYKTGLSDPSGSLAKALSAANPSNKNTRILSADDIRIMKDRLLTALETPGTKPPITFNVPGSTVTTQPQVVTPGRGPMQGPLTGGQRGQVLPGHATIQGPLIGGQRGQVLPGHETITGPIPEGTAGLARGNQAQVSIGPEGKAIAVSPRDVQGPAGPSFMLRGQPPQEVTPQIPGKPGFVLRGQPPQTVTAAVPARPAFQLAAQPGHTIPGVQIQTPGMRVQTAPAQPMAAMMPGYRTAVERNATHENLLNTMQESSDQASRIMKGFPVVGKQLRNQSGAAFSRDIHGMSKNEAAAAQEGVLGRLREQLGLSVNPLTGFGVGPSLTHANRIAPYVRQIDQQSGNALPDLLQKLGIVAATPQ